MRFTALFAKEVLELGGESRLRLNQETDKLVITGFPPPSRVVPTFAAMENTDGFELSG